MGTWTLATKSMYVTIVSSLHISSVLLRAGLIPKFVMIKDELEERQESRMTIGMAAQWRKTPHPTEAYFCRFHNDKKRSKGILP